MLVTAVIFVIAAFTFKAKWLKEMCPEDSCNIYKVDTNRIRLENSLLKQLIAIFFTPIEICM